MFVYIYSGREYLFQAPLDFSKFKISGKFNSSISISSGQNDAYYIEACQFYNLTQSFILRSLFLPNYSSFCLQFPCYTNWAKIKEGNLTIKPLTLLSMQTIVHNVLSYPLTMKSSPLPSTVLPLVNLACFSVFVWQLYLIVEEYIHPQESNINRHVLGKIFDSL